jgi:hypothetical protein
MFNREYAAMRYSYLYKHRASQHGITKFFGLPAYHFTRLMVFALTPYERARNLHDSPASLRRLISPIWKGLSLNLGPNFIPDALARCLPSEVRRAIKSLSNSATPPKTVSMNLPTAVEC